MPFIVLGLLHKAIDDLFSSGSIYLTMFDTLIGLIIKQCKPDNYDLDY